MTIGEKIKLKRVENKISQEELARIIGCKQKTISNWENDTVEPNPQYLPKLSQFLSIPLGELTNTPEIYKCYEKEDNKEGNNVMKLIHTLREMKIITSNNIDDSTRDVIINTVKKYLEEKENRED